MISQESNIKCLQLQELITSSNSYLEEFKVFCAAVTENHRLTQLDLSLSKLTDEHVLLISNVIKGNSALKLLDLKDCDVTKSGSKYIAQAIAGNSSCILEDIFGIRLRIPECLEALNLDKLFGKQSNSNILKYCKARKSEGQVEVKRIRLIFVGNGATGKTTLIKRLKHNTFDESLIITDGVDISSLKLKDVEMTVFDFAGQPEYEHTHSLFFDESALFVLLHSPRSATLNWHQELQVFLTMILNCAPSAEIVLVTTRADDAVLSVEDIESIKAMCPNNNIKHCVPVDSKSGKGIAELIDILVDVSMKNVNTIKQIPRSFERLHVELASIEKDVFSIPVEKIGQMYPWWPSNMTTLALELFKNWVMF